MHLSRSRYVTVCQQLLAAATVTAVGLTAAGVMTLDIVGPEAAGAGPVAAGQGLSRDLRSAVHVRPGYVDTGPVTPKVREVRLTGAPTSGSTGTAPPASESTSADRAAGARESAGADPGARPRLTSAPNDADRKAPETVEGMPVAVLSPPEKVSGYATVGVTWSPQVHLGEDEIALQVRTLRDGDWSAWQALEYHDDHAPDPGDAGDDGSRPGTDPSVVGHVDAVQMRAATATGKAPADIRLALVDPGEGHLGKQAPAIDTAKIPASDDTATGADPVESTGPDTATQGDAALRAMKVAPKPKIYSRAQWGANERIREQSRPDYGTIKTGFVHHTVNANDYTRKQVPSIIRGIYAYHVEGRGWRDIGYNFLVDRFGRIWEGRWGGVNRPVVGAHTYGYNDVSFAMSAIGNYDIKEPSKAIINAYARLFAWKLSKYDIRANAKGLRIRGTTLHAINGHRDVSATACPGRYLYAKLPQIRKEARAIQRGVQPPDTPAPVVASQNGVTATASGGTGQVDLVAYKSNPRAKTTTPTSGSFFGLGLSSGNTFSKVVLENCSLNTGTSLEWWDADAGKKGRWRPVAGSSVDTSGLPQCLAVTLDKTSSPTLEQLDDTTFAVVNPTTVSRLFGADRYATAAAVALQAHQSGASRVYVTSGAGFADALSAGVPAGMRQAPVLLVRQDGVPRYARQALKQLSPRRIIVVGGTGAVSNYAAGELERFASGAVTRLAGIDRYATAATVATASFPKGATTAYVASGEDFPDALSAVAAAATAKAPILLTRSDSVPRVTVSALKSLGVSKIVALGGPAALSSAVIHRLSSLGHISRIFGADRYQTSARVADTFRSGEPETVYLASGAAFADAIAAGAVAGAQSAPVLLSRPGKLPAVTRAELLELGSRNVVALGGVSALADGVLTAVRAALYGQ